MLRVKLQGMQKEVLALPAKGHIVVLGTAGSGKTTVALYRAFHLANIPKNGNVLLVTFNGALVEYMKGISEKLPQNLTIEKYHLFARGFLNSKGKMEGYNSILDARGRALLIDKAVRTLKRQYPDESTLRRPKEFFIDEITFIQHFGFEDFEAYYSADRVGRASANIKRENRKWVYKVLEEYIKLRDEKGRKYDWDDLAFHLFNELKNDDTERRYKHIIIDEGQDFSPMMIKSLVKSIAPEGTLTFFGDVAQQIYGSRLTWRDSGINTDKIWKFDINYRNPIAIVQFAQSLTNSKYWIHDQDMIDVKTQIAEGPKPVLVQFTNADNEINWILKQVDITRKTSSTVVICRNRADVRAFMEFFRKHGIKATEIDSNTPGYASVKTVYVTTFHSAKGLEFDNVFIPFLSDGKFPDPEAINRSSSEAEVFSDELKLLYVASTRSKYALYMTYHGDLSPIFAADSKTYSFYTEGELV